MQWGNQHNVRENISLKLYDILTVKKQNKTNLCLVSITAQPLLFASNTIHQDSIRRQLSPYYGTHCIVYMVEQSVSSSKCSSFDWISHYGHQGRSTRLSLDYPNRLLSEGVHLLLYLFTDPRAVNVLPNINKTLRAQLKMSADGDSEAPRGGSLCKAINRYVSCHSISFGHATTMLRKLSKLKIKGRLLNWVTCRGSHQPSA